MRPNVLLLVCMIAVSAAFFSAPRRAAAAPPSIGVVADDPAVAFADRMKTGRVTWDSAAHFGDGQAPPLDANGWPTGDASNIVWEGVSKNDGTYTIVFNGIATLAASYGYATFSPQNADGTTGSYNSATNTTTATMVVTDTGFENFSLVLTNTKRTASSAANTGVTNIQVLRPVSEGATTSYSPATTFTTQFKTMEAPYTTFRFLGWDAANGTTQANWTDRVLPTYAQQRNPVAWEYMVQVCNETNKDLYVNIPEEATDDYITHLAELIAYGSDAGGTVYTSPQASPVHAPLNSNLNVYIEYSNEVWNYFFPQFGQNLSAVQADIAAQNAEYLNLDFDHLDTSGPDANGNYNNQYVLIYRRQAERIKDSSDIFRSVFGDAAMPPNPNPRIRPVLEWQYANANATADTELGYLDNYYNDGDGTPHFGTPHAPAYYLYGGGGATYFSSNNDDGVTSLLQDGSFESPAVTGSQADPSGGPWTFRGTAGIVANGSSFNNPAAADGVQAGYVEGIGGVNGSLTQTVTFPSNQVSNEYAVQFQAVQRTKSGAATADAQSFNVLFDGTVIGSFTPSAYYSVGPWPHFITSGFTVSAGSTHTIQFVGTSASGDNTAFLDSVAITSTDAIFASGIPSTGYTATLQTEADWAVAFGLRDVAYESGWSLQSAESNGWETGSNVTIAAKYDPRATQPAINAENAFTAAGGALNIYLQTYSSAYDDIWAFTDDVTNLNTPLYQAILGIAAETAVSVTNGTVIPATVTTQAIPRQYDTDWASYNLLVPTQGTYFIGARVNQNSAGTMQFYADNVLIGTTTAPSFGLSSPFGATLAPGLHAVRVKGSGFSLTSLIVTSAPYPGAPANLTALPSDGAITLSWTAPPGSVASYDVYRGTSAGGEGATPYATGITSPRFVDAGLVNGTQYFYFVVGVNGGTEGNASSEVSGVTGYFANPGFETGTLAGWFGGGANHGVDASAPHSGTYECYNQGYYNSIYQTISGLMPNTTYVATAWGRLANPGPATSASLYVSNYGGSALNADFIGTTYAQYSITFTTGPNNTSAQIGQGMDGSQTVGSYVDDFALSPVAATPVFSPAGGAYTSAQSVTISAATPGAVIHYTTDGSMPTASSAVYANPISVTANETIQAVAVTPGYASGGVASATYTVTVGSPTIASIAPLTGTPGTLVMITGTNFTGATAVNFHDALAKTFSVNAAGTQITVAVPQGAQNGTLRVTTPSGKVVSAQSFTVIQTAPTITSLTPASGPAGTVVTIAGTNLGGVTTVRFHNANATAFAVNAGGTQITATVPARALSGTVRVTTPNGSVTSAQSFTVRGTSGTGGGEGSYVVRFLARRVNAPSASAPMPKASQADGSGVAITPLGV